MIYAVWLDGENQHEAAWKLLKFALLKEYDIDINTCTVVENKWGKPGFAKYPSIHFSLSHCKKIAACIIADTEVGIDAELVGRNCSDRVIRRVLTDEEYERIINMCRSKTDMSAEFLKYWTLKECYGKAIGRGLSYDLKSVGFRINDDKIICNADGYKFKQQWIKKDADKIIISYCKRQENCINESIEWVDFSLDY